MIEARCRAYDAYRRCRIPHVELQRCDLGPWRWGTQGELGMNGPWAALRRGRPPCHRASPRSVERVIEALHADITTLPIDAIVNAANASLLGGGGVDGAIHRAAGPRAARRVPPARRVPHRRRGGDRRPRPPGPWVIHTVGPVWRGGEPRRARAARLVLPPVARGGRRARRPVDRVPCHLDGHLRLPEGRGRGASPSRPSARCSRPRRSSGSCSSPSTTPTSPATRRCSPMAELDAGARCPWATSDELYIAYHDDEWGRPVVDDTRLFEKLCLEGFQAGLAWITILRKREAFRAAFAGFDPEVVAGFGDRRRRAAARRRGHRPPPREDRGRHLQRGPLRRPVRGVGLARRVRVVVRAVAHPRSPALRWATCRRRRPSRRR